MLTRLKRLISQTLNYSFTAPSAQGPLRIPVIYGVGRAHRDLHEPHMTAVLQRLHKPGTTLVDIGVNIGQTLLKFVSVAGRDARYVGFEPNVRAASYVDELILRNALTNAAVVPVGLGETTRIAALLVGSQGTPDPGASINAEMRDADFYGAAKAVAILRGDDIFADLAVTAPMILKIDVEGAELEVLKGLSSVLSNIRPPVLLEILPPEGFSEAVGAYRVDQGEQIKALMAGHGYACSAICHDGTLVDGVSPTNDYLFEAI